jgi:hypothetical protein
MLFRAALVVFALSAAAVPALAQMEACRTDAYAKAPESDVIPFMALDLDLAPEQRWIDIILAKSDAVNNIVTYLFSKLPHLVEPEVVAFLNRDLAPLAGELGEFGKEMIGVSKASGLPLGQIVAMNIMYEAFTVCTSIVAENQNGDIVHGRNLDFGLFMGCVPKGGAISVLFCFDFFSYFFRVSQPGVYFFSRKRKQKMERIPSGFSLSLFSFFFIVIFFFFSLHARLTFILIYFSPPARARAAAGTTRTTPGS